MNVTSSILTGVVMAAVVASAATVNYTGTTGGAYGTVENWTVDGTGTHQLPGASDTAVVPDGTTVLVANATDRTALAATGKLNLDGASARVTVRDVDVNLTTPCELLGSGVFTATNTVAHPGIWLKVAGTNTNFKGRFDFYGIRVYAANERSLGVSNRVDFVNTLGSTGAQSDAILIFSKPGHNYNDLRLKIVGGYYWLLQYEGTGDLVFHNSIAVQSNFARFEGGSRSNSHLIIDEDCALTIPVGGQIDFNGRVRVLGTDKIYDGASNEKSLWSDNGQLTDGLYVERKVKGGVAVQASYVTLGQQDQLVVGDTVAAATLGNDGGGYYGQIDLNGFDQTFGTFSFGVPTLAQYMNAPAPQVVQSLTSGAGPAILTLTKSPRNCAHVFGGTLDGALSVTFDAAGGTFSLTNRFPYTKATQTWGTERVASTLKGAIWAKRGTISLGAVRMPFVSQLRAGEATSTDAATLAITSSEAVLNSNVVVSVAGAGTVELAAGVTLTVLLAENADGYIPVGTYGAENATSLPNGFAGQGTLKVKICPGNGTFVYVGGSGAFSPAAANWIPAEMPSANSQLVFQNVDVVATETQYNDFLNQMDTLNLIGGSLTVANATGALTQNVKLLGDGAFSVLSSVKDVDKKFQLKADNSGYSGVFTVSNYFVEVRHARAFAKDAKVVLWGPSKSDQRGWVLTYCVNAVYENELEVHNGNSWWAIAASSCAVTNKGAFTYSAHASDGVTRLQGTGNGGYLAFQGPMTGLVGKLLLNDVVELSGTDPIVLAPGNTGTLYCDSRGSVIYLDKTIAAKTSDNATPGGILQLAYGTWHLMSDRDVLRDVRINLGSSAVPTVLNLHGHNATIGHYEQGWSETYRVNTAYNADFTFTSETPAKVTFRSIIAHRAGWGPKVNGQVSLGIDQYDYGCWDGTWTLTLTNAADTASTTTGALEPTVGSFRLTENTRMPNLSKIKIGPHGSIWVMGTPEINRKVEIEFPAAVTKSSYNADGWDGVLAISEGAMLVVENAYTNGVKLAPGSYTMARLPYIKGASINATTSGTLLVNGTGTMILFR